jgi:lipoprotein-anchoring transpeptidase ErfK/SrfK
MKETTAMNWSRRVVVHILLAGVWAVSLLALVYPARVQAQGGGGSVHVVEAGETLSQIARRYGTDVATLLELNGLSNANFVYSGQQLVVSGGGGQQSQWQDEQPERYAPNSARQDTSWEEQNSGGPYQRAGVGWEPQATQRSPYRDPQPSETQWADGNPVASDSWESPNSQRNPYLEDWEPLHSEGNAYPPGRSWEPTDSQQSSRKASERSEALTGEKWIDIDIGDQVLTAYQGDTVVRTFVISSGSARYPTVTGTFYTYARIEIQDMSGGSQAAGDYYFQADVPWVQYFFEGYAIHGAYWHNSFGTPIGHGCINMRVEESRWLYDWAEVTGIRVEVHQ